MFNSRLLRKIRHLAKIIATTFCMSGRGYCHVHDRVCVSFVRFGSPARSAWFSQVLHTSFSHLNNRSASRLRVVILNHMVNLSLLSSFTPIFFWNYDDHAPSILYQILYNIIAQTLISYCNSQLDPSFHWEAFLSSIEVSRSINTEGLLF